MVELAKKADDEVPPDSAEVGFGDAVHELCEAVVDLRAAIKRRNRDETAHKRLQRRRSHVRSLQARLTREQLRRQRAVEAIDQAVLALEHYIAAQRGTGDGRV